jgi:hypothetical protein
MTDTDDRPSIAELQRLAIKESDEEIAAYGHICARCNGVTLLIYLLGKAARAHFDGDRPKLEHHVITTAAVALNWWRHLTGVSTAMRPGVAR